MVKGYANGARLCATGPLGGHSPVEDKRFVFENLRDIVARIGFADVRAFGLTWEDCETFLNRLGYRAQGHVSPVI